MESNYSQENNLPDIIKNFIKDNYKWILGSASSISIISCFTTLWIYTRYIGRPDIFSESIEITPQTFLIFATAFLSLLALLAILFLPSYFLIQGRLGLKVDNNNRKHVVCWLAGITVLNIICLIIIIVVISFTSWTPEWSGTWLIPGFLSSFIMTVIFLWRNKETATCFTASLLVVGGSLFICATISTFSFLLISNTYKSTDNFSSALLFLQWLAIMLLSLAPAISYLLAEEDHLIKIVKKVLIGIVLCTVLITIITPSLLGNFALGAIRIARLIDNHPRYYQVFQKDYNVANLDKNKWGIDHVNNDSYRIIATSLYSFGSKRLLCPKEISKIKSADFRLYTYQCILFDKSSIKTLERVI